MAILNLINQLLAYSDSVSTDNPNQRLYDFTRKLSAIAIENPTSDTKIIPPGEALTLFSGVRDTDLTIASVLSLELLSPTTSTYRLKVTSGPSGFRMARAISGVGSVTVAINNNAVAVFTFTGASLPGVVSGDTLRVNGASLNDTGPFAFNPLNSGLWKVIGVSGVNVSCTRLTGESFSGANETVAVATADVQIYSAAGVQINDKVSITGSFSPVTQRTYTVSAVTPSTLDFVSAMPLPNETGVAYVADSIICYTNSKRFVYIECDQEAVVRFNADSSDNVKISPLTPGDPTLPGMLQKIGDTYSATVINKSVNSLNVKYFLAE